MNEKNSTQKFDPSTAAGMPPFELREEDLIESEATLEAAAGFAELTGKLESILGADSTRDDGEAS